MCRARSGGVVSLDMGSTLIACSAQDEKQKQQPKAEPEEIAARFSQASAELQVLGLLRPARKRRGDFAHKLIPHLESSL